MTSSPDIRADAIRWATPKTPRHRLAAAQLARSALARAPDNPSLHLTLARALAGTGDLEQAETVLSLALERLPDREDLYEELAYVLARQGKVEAALACARDRDSPWAAPFAFKLLIRHGRRSEAEALEPAVAALTPVDPDLLESRVKRVRGEPERLLGLCEDVLSHDPGAAHALHYKAVALAQLGRGREAAELMGLDRFLHAAPLPAPPGLGDGEDFRARVRSEILANPTLHPDPAGHATRSGLRTGVFPAEGDVAATALMETIRAAVGAYAGALAGDHPFVRARPDCATFTTWALLFRGAGHQLPHHHPGCWLTGVYYVSARHDPPRPGEPPPGRIRIGGLPAWAGVDPPWPLIEIAPTPGTLLLFPSFVPHETVPPGEGAERVSIAFDVTAA